eukprot:scaffold94636_cov60-Phaeocystis_antarctica.AAC.3
MERVHVLPHLVVNVTAIGRRRLLRLTDGLAQVLNLLVRALLHRLSQAGDGRCNRHATLVAALHVAFDASDGCLDLANQVFLSVAHLRDLVGPLVASRASTGKPEATIHVLAEDALVLASAVVACHAWHVHRHHRIELEIIAGRFRCDHWRQTHKLSSLRLKVLVNVRERVVAEAGSDALLNVPPQGGLGGRHVAALEALRLEDFALAQRDDGPRDDPVLFQERHHLGHRGQDMCLERSHDGPVLCNRKDRLDLVDRHRVDCERAHQPLVDQLLRLPPPVGKAADSLEVGHNKGRKRFDEEGVDQREAVLLLKRSHQLAQTVIVLAHHMWTYRVLLARHDHRHAVHRQVNVGHVTAVELGEVCAFRHLEFLAHANRVEETHDVWWERYGHVVHAATLLVGVAPGLVLAHLVQEPSKAERLLRRPALVQRVEGAHQAREAGLVFDRRREGTLESSVHGAVMRDRGHEVNLLRDAARDARAEPRVKGQEGTRLGLVRAVHSGTHEKIQLGGRLGVGELAESSLATEANGRSLVRGVVPSDGLVERGRAWRGRRRVARGAGAVPHVGQAPRPQTKRSVLMGRDGAQLRSGVV